MKKLLPLAKCLLLLAPVFGVNQVAAESITLSVNSSPSVMVYTASTASATVKAARDTLVTYLNTITSGSFVSGTFNPADGAPAGIVLGRSPELNLSGSLALTGTNAVDREAYRVGIGNGGTYLILVGATDMAVQDAVYDLLEQSFQCRWYFAGPNWKIIPSKPSLVWSPSPALGTGTITSGTKSIPLNIYISGSPDFAMRSIWAGGASPQGGWDQQAKDWSDWADFNRVRKGGLVINTSHSYDAIRAWAVTAGRWDDSFNGQVGGVRSGTNQLCLGNDQVKTLIKDYAISQLAAHPDDDSVSLEPADGSRWCECDLCKAIVESSANSVTERVIGANNFAASNIDQTKYIGMYAYNMHSTPPMNQINPRIFPFIATAYITGNYSFDQLLAGWKEKASQIGIRDYLGVWKTSKALPGIGKAADLSALKETIPYYFINKAKGYTAETTQSFGPYGLGHYLAAKLLWKADPQKIDGLKEEFFTNCFGPAAETMKLFYAHIDGANHYTFSTDLIGRLFGYLDTAETQVKDYPQFQPRLDDLVLWVHYLELQRDFSNTPIGSSLAIDRNGGILSYVWEIRSSAMVDSQAVWRNTGTDLWPSNASSTDWKALPHSLKDEKTYSHQNVLDMIATGTGSNPLLPEESRSYDLTDCIKVVSSSTATRGTLGAQLRGQYTLYMSAGTSGTLPGLSVEDGIIYTNKAPATWELTGAKGGDVLESGTIPIDTTFHPITFITSGAGNYAFSYDDHSAGSSITWPAGSTVAIQADAIEPYSNYRSSRLYFYVPKGTQRVMVHAHSFSTGTFFSASGSSKWAISSTDLPMVDKDLTMCVRIGEDNQFWYVKDLAPSGLVFLNTPGLVGLRPDEMLVPRDALSWLTPSGQAAATRGTVTKIRGKNAYHLSLKPDGSLPMLTVTDGYLYSTLGNATWTLYTGDGRTVVQSGTIVPNAQPNVLSLLTPSSTLPNTGHYLFVYDDKMAASTVDWDSGDNVSISASADLPYTSPWRNDVLYFYVPKGTSQVSFSAEAVADFKIYDGGGTLVYTNPSGTTSKNIDVPSGKDGQIWSITNLACTNFRWLTIPGVMARNRNELLIPYWCTLP